MMQWPSQDKKQTLILMISSSYPQIPSPPPSPHQRLRGGNHCQHGWLSALNQSQVSHKICQGTVKEINISFRQTYFQKVMAGMWFSGCHRDKHERGGLRYAGTAVLAPSPAAQRAHTAVVIACSAEAWAEHLLGSTSLHLPERKVWHFRLIY